MRRAAVRSPSRDGTRAARAKKAPLARGSEESRAARASTQRATTAGSELVLVARVAAHGRSLQQRDGLVAVVVGLAACASPRRATARCPGPSGRGTCGNVSLVVLGDFLVLQAVQLRVVDRMHAVRTLERQAERARRVARRALDQRSAVPLQLRGGDVVVGRGIRVRPLGVRAAVTALAADAAVSLRQPVQLLVLGEARRRRIDDRRRRPSLRCSS